ncbi:MAG TPA: APC family permease [Blastocatellia bacterium]|nr:APC family permease [Blastocatellia bacterium]
MNIPKQTRVRVVVATTVMLSFISFWRAAAIVLNDLASSAFYAGGIAERAAGKAAPWFILAVMLFSYAVRSIYVESSAMFTRGGVYRVVKEAMGGTLAKISVSALMFDYILTGPISGVSAGQYIVGLIAQTLTYTGHPWTPSLKTTNYLSAGIAALVTVYFWWRNIKGIRESSADALRIMKITTAMVILMIGWCTVTLMVRGPRQLPPTPVPQNLKFNKDAVGWLPRILPGAFRELHVEAPAPVTGGAEETPEPRYGLAKNAGMLIGLIGILIAFGHSVLAMSGEESLAQVNRELEHPKHKNLMRAGLVIFVYSLLFTSLVSFFASMLIADHERPKYFDNLISGLAMNVVGPTTLLLFFQAFVVFVGFLILSGAINTAIVGSNGVLNRVSEDGVMTDWFRAPHKRYGTTYRMINMIVLLQLITIIGSRGEVYVLGEAYAFGVVWSFAFKGLAMLVLRYTDKSPREWKVPGNLYFGRTEIPIGLGAIAAVLFLVAGLNLFTKEVATISGVVFTIVFYTIFSISERINQRKKSHHTAADSLDQFRLAYEQDVTRESVHARPGNTMVAVRDYNTLSHLEWVLTHTNTEQRDIVVMTVRLITGPDSGERDLYNDMLFTDYEQRLFTKIVALAEKHGKPVELLVVPSNNVFEAIAQAGLRLDSGKIVSGSSAKMSVQEQARALGKSWERLPETPRHQIEFVIVEPDGKLDTFFLGAHAPNLTEDDIDLIHRIWVQVSKSPTRQKVHHRDVVRVALNRLERDLKGRSDVMLDFYKLEHSPPPAEARGEKGDGVRPK